MFLSKVGNRQIRFKNNNKGRVYGRRIVNVITNGKQDNNGSSEAVSS